MLGGEQDVSGEKCKVRKTISVIYIFIYVLYLGMEGKFVGFFFSSPVSFFVSQAHKTSVSQPLPPLPEPKFLVALVLLQGPFVLTKGPIERALNIPNAAAHLLAAC